MSVGEGICFQRGVVRNSINCGCRKELDPFISLREEELIPYVAPEKRTHPTEDVQGRDEPEGDLEKTEDA